MRIEAKRCVAYRLFMQSLFLRLLLLVAVALMPFGMAAAPAASVQHQQMAGAATQHCAEKESNGGTTQVLADCTMACAAALPAADLPPPDGPAASRMRGQPTFIPTLSGIELEIATPPPRAS
jgi:hypothetical protein